MNTGANKNIRQFSQPGVIIKTMIALSGLFFFISLNSCDKSDKDEGFKVDFSFTFVDENHVAFTNQSSGEYFSLIWNFGNNLTDTTTDKKKSYVIYYPQAGSYDVTLKLINFTGASKSLTKALSISSTDLVLSFTASIMGSNPNFVLLKNTTQGDYDSFSWVYRDKTVSGIMEHEAYFPFSGNHNIDLIVRKNNNDFSLRKSVSIGQDDPNYYQQLQLVWSDEFDGTSVNTTFWNYDTGAGGWGNQELQNYTSSGNAEIVDGKLLITAKKVNDNLQPGSYTSARINTRGKKEFKYGRMEIRAKLPSGRGIWPAIWMLGSNFPTAGWPACGEMDIMEYVGYQPNTVHATVHTPSGYGVNGSGSSMTLETCEEEFHNYGLIWTEKKLTFYVDTPTNVIHTYAPPVKNPQNWPFDQAAFFIINVAVGGTWGGAQGINNSIFPQTMEIEYVRVYQEVK